MLGTYTNTDLAAYRINKATGTIINEDHRRIAQIIHDYDNHLEVQWIPPEERSYDSPETFRVVHHEPFYEVMRFPEWEMDERILARIFASDQKRHDVVSELDAMETAKELVKAKQWEESMAEAREFSLTVLKSKKHLFKHDGVRYE